MEIGAFEILAVAAIALLFFGPSKLPQMGKSVGEAIRGFKKGMSDMQSGMDDVKNDIKKENRSDSNQTASSSRSNESRTDQTSQPPRADQFTGAAPSVAPDEKITTDILKDPVNSGRKDS
jgi:TatA/E family protein of Tat protein translocase